MSQFLFRLRLNDKTFYGMVRNWRDFFPAIRINEKYRTRWPTFSFEEISFTKGAKTYIDEQRAIFGALASVTAALDMWNTSTLSWDDFISGKLAFDRYRKKKVETLVGIDPESFIMKVLNRDETVMRLTDLTDMDGGAVTPFSQELVTVTLDHDILSKRFISETKSEPIDNYVGGTFVGTVNVYYQLGGQVAVIDELEGEGIILPSSWAVQLDNVQPFVLLKDQGDEYFVNFTYNILCELGVSVQSGTAAMTVELVAALYDYTTDSWTTFILETISFANASPSANFAFIGSSSEINWTGEINNDGDLFNQARLYIRVNLTGGSYNVNYDVTVNSLTIDVLKKDTYEDTTCKGMLVWEAALRMLQKITGKNDPLRSSILCRTDSEVHTCAEDGEASLLFYTNGRLVRQFPESDYPLIGEFYQLIRALNADYNIGVGVITEGGQRYIAIEKIAYFWDNAKVAFSITDPRDLEEETAVEYLFSEIKGGNEKYRNEENGTLGSPHTPRNYTTELGDVVKNTYDYTQLAITSSPLIELLRRDPFKEGQVKDNEHDTTPVLIRLKRSGSSYVRERGSDLDLVSNLTNSDTHYNLGMTPARALRNHLNWIAGGVWQKHNTGAFQVLRFQNGEGNVDVVTRLTVGGSTITEKNNVSVILADEVLFIPNRAIFDFALTKAQMISLIADPNQCIEVTYKGKTAKYFIESADIKNFDNKLADFSLIEAYTPPA